MEGGVTSERLTCRARTHARVIDQRFIRIGCRDNNCPDARLAKQQGKLCIHVWDIATGESWTDFEEATNGRNSSLQL